MSQRFSPGEGGGAGAASYLACSGGRGDGTPTWPPPKSAQRRKNLEAGIRHRWCPPPSPSFLSEHKKKNVQDQDRRRPPNHGLARRDLRVFLPNQSPDHSRTEQNKHGRTSEAREEGRSEQRKSPGSRIKRRARVYFLQEKTFDAKDTRTERGRSTTGALLPKGIAVHVSTIPSSPVQFCFTPST